MKTIFAIILIVALLGTAFYIGTEVNKEVEYIETVIDLTDSEKKQIEQEARLNYITEDSALTLGWNLVEWALANQDSTKLISWEIRDSINVKDSTPVYYVPYFEAEDTIVAFDETVKDIRVQASVVIQPRYFPTYNRFVTDVKLHSLTVTAPYEAPSRWGLGIYGGFGIGYSYQAGQRDHYNNDNSYQTFAHDHEGWYYGWQLGIGLTYDIIEF